MAKSTADPTLTSLVGAVFDRTSEQLRELTSAPASTAAPAVSSGAKAQTLPAPVAAYGKQLVAEAATLAKQTGAAKKVALADLARLEQVVAGG